MSEKEDLDLGRGVRPVVTSRLLLGLLVATILVSAFFGADTFVADSQSSRPSEDIFRNSQTLEVLSA